MWGNHHISPRLLKSEVNVWVEREFLKAKIFITLEILVLQNPLNGRDSDEMRWDSSFFNHQGSRYESSPFRDVLKFPFLEILESPADIQLKIHWFQQMLGAQCQNPPVQWPELCGMGAAEFLLAPKVPLHTVNTLSYHDCLVKCMRFFVLKAMAVAFWVVRGLLTLFPLLVCSPELAFPWEWCCGSGWSTQDRGAAEIV